MTEQAQEPSNDLAIVRQRMRHLARLNIEPKPMLRAADHGALSVPVCRQSQERLSHLAWQVLAVQMGYAAPMSALD